MHDSGVCPSVHQEVATLWCSKHHYRRTLCVVVVVLFSGLSVWLMLPWQQPRVPMSRATGWMDGLLVLSRDVGWGSKLNKSLFLSITSSERNEQYHSEFAFWFREKLIGSLAEMFHFFLSLFCLSGWCLSFIWPSLCGGSKILSDQWFCWFGFRWVGPVLVRRRAICWSRYLQNTFREFLQI